MVKYYLLAMKQILKGIRKETYIIMLPCIIGNIIYYSINDYFSMRNQLILLFAIAIVSASIPVVYFSVRFFRTGLKDMAYKIKKDEDERLNSATG